MFGEAVSDAEIERLAQAHYAHLWRLVVEFLRFRWMSAERKKAIVDIENVDVFRRALERGKGILVLTGHFGNWEVATVAALAAFRSCAAGSISCGGRSSRAGSIVSSTGGSSRAGFGVLPKRGSLDAILDALAAGDAIVFPFDQHAGPPDGIEVDFFGHPAWTFKSLALLALASGAQVLPAASWRNPDGRHVLRFEEALAVGEPPTTWARRSVATTRAYNAALERLVLRHPEQWYWVHRRWKKRLRRGAATAARSRPRRGRRMTSMQRGPTMIDCAAQGRFACLRCAV